MSTIKLCECGCGQPTTLSKTNLPKRGYIKGEPLRYLPGHKQRLTKWSEERRQAFAEKMQGHPVSSETRRKLSEYNKAHGVRPSDEAVQKSNANRGKGQASKTWKGGITVTNGYRCVFKPDHPRAHPNGYVYEHVLIAEAKLGRPLVEAEVVHHIDGDKLNNTPVNLAVLASQADHVRLHLEKRRKPSPKR